MSGKKKILYIQTSGVDQPERTYAPFILATTAAMMDIKATVYFIIKGRTLVKKGKDEKRKYCTSKQAELTNRNEHTRHSYWPQQQQ